MKNTYAPPPPGLPRGARVWIYCRDSGGAKQTESVRQQEESIRAYCEKYSLVIDTNGVFRDFARSGGSVVKRDNFLEMIEKSQDELSRPQGLLCYDISRFARNYNEFNHYESALTMRGIIVHYLDDNIPDDFYSGQVVKAVKALGADEFRRELSRKVKRGLNDLVSSGKGFAPGTPPRGYIGMPVEIGLTRDGKPHIVSKWVPDPVLAEYVKLAFQLRANGKSYKEIAKATSGKLYTSINSWNTFFCNKSYLGFYGKEDIPDHHEPLINFEVFEAVQKLRKAHLKYDEKGRMDHPRRVGNPNLLSGFTYCMDCGVLVAYGWANKKNPWTFYMCGKKNRHGYAACASKRIGAKNAEAQIMNAVLNKVLTPKYLSEVIADTKKKFTSTNELERQIKVTRRNLEDLDISIQKLLTTIEKTGSESAQERLMQREAEKIQAKSDVERLSAQLAMAQIEITPEAMDKIINKWRDQFNKIQETGNVRDIKSWLMQFVSRIDLGYNRARLYFTYPMIEFSQNANSLKQRPSVGAHK